MKIIISGIRTRANVGNYFLYDVRLLAVASVLLSFELCNLFFFALLAFDCLSSSLLTVTVLMLLRVIFVYLLIHVGFSC